MTQENHLLTHQERYGVTRKKHITITLSGHERIQAWADAHDVNFSTAIEALALLGMDGDAATAYPRLVAQLFERVLNRQFKRLSKLLAQIALSTSALDWKMDVLLLQEIRREAVADPEQFVANMTVSHDADDITAARIRRMRDELKTIAHQQAIVALKQPLKLALDFELDANDDGV